MLVTVLAIFVLAVAVSCGGNDDSDNGESVDPEGSNAIATSTPAAPDPTASTETTASATATPAAQSDPSGTSVPPTPVPMDEQEGSIRPPVVELSDGSEEMEGVFGPYGWIDEPSQSYILTQAPFYDVGDEGLTVAPGSELEFNILTEVAPPAETTVSVYGWDENSAIPGDTEGNVGTHLFFVPRLDPLSSEIFPDTEVTFSMPEEPGRYVVRVDVNWPADPRLDPVQQPIFASYGFTVYVE